MKSTCCRVAIITAAAVLSAALLPGQQAPVANAAQAQAAARFNANARVLTVFDREGKTLRTFKEPGLWQQPVFSPDGTRVAVFKTDIEKRIGDIWVLDVATGASARITSNQAGERVRSPLWSPDGSQVAYVAVRNSYEGVYRKAASGEGPEELLYQSPGAGLNLSDWSMDGRFLTFFTNNLAGGTLYMLPLGGAGERKPVQVFRSESQLQGEGLSPDGRFLAYRSDQSGKNEIYVRTLDASAGGPWQVSDQGAQGMASWRRDGKEVYYLAPDRAVMAVEVGTAPTFEFGKPRLLFRPPEALLFNAGLANVSRDGQRVVIAVPTAPQLRQITVFDRQGKVLNKVGEPGVYFSPSLSPDGTRVAVSRTDLNSGDQDIWTFDVATGKGTPVTNDAPPDNIPIWSLDGNQVSYTSRRGSYSGIYRKAWNGTGNEELLFRYTPGASMILTDVSPDGKFVSFSDGCGGVLFVVPLTGADALARKAIEWLREEYDVPQGRFSPDMRFIAYLSNEADPTRFEVYVRPFDATKPESVAAGPVVRVSQKGARNILWRQDGKEMYFLESDPQTTEEFRVMAVEVSTTPTFQAGTPTLLFKVPLMETRGWVSSDGQRFVFTVPVPVTPSR